MTDTTNNDEPNTPTGAAIVEGLDAWSEGTSDPELRSLLSRAGDHIEFIETEAEAVRRGGTTTPTHEQIAAIDRVRDRLSNAAEWATDVCVARDDLDAVLALFSQPSPNTPSAEPELMPEQRRKRMSSCTLEPIMSAAEPVRVEDMAPGTTFWARAGKGPVVRRMVGDDRWLYGTDGHGCDATVIDRRTIRDVTPPPALPEDGR